MPNYGVGVDVLAPRPEAPPHWARVARFSLPFICDGACQSDTYTPCTYSNPDGCVRARLGDLKLSADGQRLYVQISRDSGGIGGIGGRERGI